jgi:hypothetical protein
MAHLTFHSRLQLQAALVGGLEAALVCTSRQLTRSSKYRRRLLS